MSEARHTSAASNAHSLAVPVKDEPPSLWNRARVPILDRYVFNELAVPFLIALFVFTGILFLARSLRLLDLVVNKNVSLWDIAQLFLFIVPQFFEIAIPMALLLGAILAFGRLSADSELIVLRASGIGMRELLKPVIAFAILATILCLILSLWLRPLSNALLGQKMFEMAQKKASAGIIAGVFNDFGQLTIYTESISAGGAMQKVLIADRRQPQNQKTFLAQNGQIVSDEVARAMMLQLYDGSIHEGTGLNYNLTYFDINNIVLDQSDLSGDTDARGKKSNELSHAEIIAARKGFMPELTIEAGEDRTTKILDQQARINVEFHRRFSVPISCLVVSLLGISLGVQPARGSKSWGLAVNIVLGILVITFYYFAIAFSTALGEERTLPVPLVMWTPNVLFGLLGIYVYRQIESEEWAAVSLALGDFFQNLKAWFNALGRSNENGGGG